MRLSDIAEFVSEKIELENIALEQYVTTDSLLPNKQGRETATNLPPQSCKLTYFKPGDVLVANIRPYLKKVWMADCEGGSSADVLTFRAKQGHSSAFLYAVLLQDAFLDYAMLGAKGSKMPRGDKEQIMRYKMPTFSPTDEEKIGNLIVNLNKKVANSIAINHNLEAMAKQLYDYWFLQFDFPDENGKSYKSSGGKMVWNEKLKREIPEGWELTHLRDFINLEDNKRIPLSSKERSIRQGKYPYYGATGIMDRVDDYLFDDDRILLAEDGSTSTPEGTPIIQYVWGKYWVNNHAHIIIPKDKENILYTYQLLNRIPAKKIETGSIQKKISQENMLGYRFALPPQALIKAYCTIVTPLWEQYKQITEQITSLTKLRNELLPLLMNGQALLQNCD